MAAITRHRGPKFDEILEGFPYLRRKLLGVPTIGRGRGAVTSTRKLRRVTRGNVALIGDASGSADAITGEGLASAFREALLLGEALGRHSIRDYEIGHSRILRIPQAMAAMMLAMDRWPWLRNRALRLLAEDSELFTRLLAVHVGDIVPAGFGVGLGLRLMGRLLYPKTSSEAAAPQDASQVNAGGAEFGQAEATL
ncbi:Ubiquinone biosynthesis monooxygenase UbiF/COQ7 [Acidisarcina polymorpha]|uniref:Ubiquinone biosynthesis monooxygenase UbiF/COQ7 n=2 Tax=Acidisarcina polymorpha TaxID=2211140 RepID=A0A2Z5G6S7_9BACT|nr:Ubiquinone biosynthesis monooxygenase UbiF/COQ7 [Acidisarcina polymorpha]